PPFPPHQLSLAAGVEGIVRCHARGGLFRLFEGQQPPPPRKRSYGCAGPRRTPLGADFFRRVAQHFNFRLQGKEIPMAERKDASRKDALSWSPPADGEAQRAMVVQELAAAGFKTLRAYLDKTKQDPASSVVEHRCLHADIAVTAIAFTAEGRY